MAWKQPISTEILNSDMFDDIDRLMFLEICIHFRNNDGYCKPFMHGNKFFRVYLKRGEAIFNTKRFCRTVGINSKVGTQKLDFLKNTALKVELKQKPYGFIVSLKNPDDFFQMELKRNSKGTQRELKRNANNKNVKNDKNIEEENTGGDHLTFCDGLLTINKRVFDGLSSTFGGGELESLIERMGDYIRSTGKTYKDHTATLRTWIRREYGIPTVDKQRLSKITTTEWRQILNKKPETLRILRKINAEIFLDIKDEYSNF